MPRPRSATGASEFIDDSAERAGVGVSDRAPRNLSRKDAVAYNKNQEEYITQLNRYATSEATRVTPQYVHVPPARKTKPKPVVGFVSNPALPGNITLTKVVGEGPSKAELKRKEDARKVAVYRHKHPASQSYAETLNASRLVDQGVRVLTTCIYETKEEGRTVKTGNYDSVVKPVARRKLKNGTLGKQRYRLVGMCRHCHRAESTWLKEGCT